MEISREALSLLNHCHAGQFSPRRMQFPDSAAHAGHADHIQAESAHQQHQRNEPPPIDSRYAALHPNRDEEREEGKEYDAGKRYAHRKQHSGNSTHSDKEPEKGQAIDQTEHSDLQREGDKEEQRSAGVGTHPYSLTCWMRPHQPGVASREKEQGEESHSKVQRRKWLAHQRDQRKEKTHQPGVLIEPPEVEGDATGDNHFICRLYSTGAGGSRPISSLLARSRLHVRETSFPLMVPALVSRPILPFHSPAR